MPNAPLTTCGMTAMPWALAINCSGIEFSGIFMISVRTLTASTARSACVDCLLDCWAVTGVVRANTTTKDHSAVRIKLLNIKPPQKRWTTFVLLSLDWISSLNDAYQYRRNGQYQQDMDKAAQRV